MLLYCKKRVGNNTKRKSRSNHLAIGSGAHPKSDYDFEGRKKEVNSTERREGGINKHTFEKNLMCHFIQVRSSQTI